MSEPAERLWLWIWYTGPWGRIANWIWLNKQPEDGQLLDRIAVFCDEREQEWKNRYVNAGRRPAARWRTK